MPSSITTQRRPTTPKTPRTPNYSRVSPAQLAESWSFVDSNRSTNSVHESNMPPNNDLAALVGTAPVTPLRQTSFRSIDAAVPSPAQRPGSASSSSNDQLVEQLMDQSFEDEDLSEHERSLMMELREPMEPAVTRLIRQPASVTEPTVPGVQRALSQVVHDTTTASKNPQDTIRQRNVTAAARTRVSSGAFYDDGDHFDEDDLEHDASFTSSPRRIKTLSPSTRRQHTMDQNQTATRQPADGRQSSVFSQVVSKGFSWSLGLFANAFKMAQKPLAVLLAVYLFFGGVYILQMMIASSLRATLSPVCSVPGASYILPMCPASIPLADTQTTGGSSAVEFEGLMSVQDKFQQILERTADGVSLPLEMKNSETAVRDLRSLVQYSDLPAKQELTAYFGNYIETARKTARHLQLFNSHVGTAVDHVISINHWTLRFLDSALEAQSGHQASGGENSGVPSLERAGVMRVLMAPFDLVVGAPVNAVSFAYTEQALLDKYIEHTAFVSERIKDLIVEAQYVLGLLSTAEDHLGLIYGVATREEAAVETQRDAVRWSFKSLIGANSQELNGLNRQLKLLRKVDLQRSAAVSQVSALIVELESMQAGLEDLRERVAAPSVAMSVGVSVPLQVHVETIQKGVERLDDARNRIRSREDERMERALGGGR